MRRICLIPSLLVAFLASACAQQQSTPAPGTCQAQPAQFAIGYTLTDAVVEEVQRRSGAKLARVLRPDMAVTLEFNPERVNIEVDAANRVASVRCG